MAKINYYKCLLTRVLSKNYCFGKMLKKKHKTLLNTSNKIFFFLNFKNNKNPIQRLNREYYKSSQELLYSDLKQMSSTFFVQGVQK